MEKHLLWIALAIGCLCWSVGFLLTRARQTERGGTGMSPELRPYVLTALALPFLVFLATWPSRPPLFATGHGLGIGFLLGGLGALLTTWVLWRGSNVAREADVPRASALALAPCTLSLAAVALALLTLGDNLTDALLGIAIGWFCTAFLLFLGLAQAWAPGKEQAEGKKPLLLALLSGVGFAALLCAIATLGDYRGTLTEDTTSRIYGVTWSTLGLVFAGGMILALQITALPNALTTRIAQKLPLAALFSRVAGNLFPTEATGRAAARGLRLLVSLIVLLGVGRLLSRDIAEDGDSDARGIAHLLWGFFGTSRIFHVMCLGVVVGLLIWWLTASRYRQENAATSPSLSTGWQNSALAALTILAGFMAAFLMLEGYGVALMLLGVWVSLSIALSAALETGSPSDAVDAESAGAIATGLTRLGLFGVILVLFRLFTTRFESEIASGAFTDNFALFGFLAGALIPPFFAGLLLRDAGGSPSPGARLFRVVLTGLLTLAVPGLFLILWQVKAIPALLIGLAAATALEKETERERTPLAFLPALYALGVALAISQWTRHVLPLAQLTRVQKEHLLAWVIGVLIVLILGADYSGRFRAWRGRPQTPPVGVPKGAAQ